LVERGDVRADRGRDRAGCQGEDNSPGTGEGEMEMYSFQIDGPLQPYVRTTQRQKWVDLRYRRYVEWKKAVRLIANLSGLPETLPPDSRAVVSVAVMWKRRARMDGDNFIKGILDSLWKQDRRVLELHYTAFEGAKAERASVSVGIERGTDGDSEKSDLERQVS
jgi:Holliday junction resolvase RusA-like endonuclease